MELQYFPNFFRSHFGELEEQPSNEDLKIIGQSFKEYLEDVFKDKTKLSEIWDISPKSVIQRIGQPFFIKGYSPVLCLHFTEFVKKYARNLSHSPCK